MLECEVWWGSLADVRPRHVELLNPVERARRERYLRDEDRVRFTLGVGITRLAAAAVLGTTPEKVVIDRTCTDCGAQHGRPVIEGGPHVSVSHSGDRVAVAVSVNGPLGVDVEALRHLEEGVRKHVLQQGEEASGLDELFAYWTRKEALLKATGDGLRVPMTKLRVSGPGEPPRLLAWEGRADLLDRITMYDLDPGPGFAASLALIDQPETTVRQASATRLG